MQGILLNGQLRLHRNPLFENIDEAMLLWCWPTRLSALRRAWLQANLCKIQEALRARGSDIFVLEPEALPAFIREHQLSALRMASPVAPEEKALAKALGAELAPANRLFDHREAKGSFSQFRKSLKAPSMGRLNALPPTTPIKAPTLTLPPGAFRFDPGEDAANERLLYFRDQLLADYHQSRNGLLGNSFSSQLSVYLGEGILAIDHVWQCLHSASASQGRDKLLDELLWREFFQHWLAQQGAKAFAPHASTQTDERLLAWQQGHTGLPLVDAAMRELLATGYISNRARQNVASFLVHDLKQDWRAGADWFERQLLDYDVAANWGNWAYIAGLGASTRPIYFDVAWQSRQHDREASYIKAWLPELGLLPADAIHNLPWLPEQRPEGYPAPVGMADWGFKASDPKRV
ncbi:FAD-binding domain-containing protein [Gallaecimonas pentaromativorans]|uniref:FAD-binding domain-containing protein n=1 Tax=Gallaecimonas pentaromativorans TaxID=584787 RepID=UPI003A92DA45